MSGVIKAYEETIGEPVHVDEYSHLMGALGAAILAKTSEEEQNFIFDIEDIHFETKGIECSYCANNCEIICVHKDNKVIDSWGNKCDRGVPA